MQIQLCLFELNTCVFTVFFIIYTVVCVLLCVLEYFFYYDQKHSLL